MDEDTIFKYIDTHKDEFINDLKRWISIKSISALSSCREECRHMVEIVAEEMKSIGCSVEIMENPLNEQKNQNNEKRDLPPIILASFGSSESVKTVCIYGHLDVQPAVKSDGWITEPFEMTIYEDMMVGRGTTDDKGPVLGWICLLRAFKNLNIFPKINMKFIFECMEESVSIGLKEILINQKDNFFKNVDFICISDNGWVGKKKPCLTYGLRGLIHFYLEISGPKKDLHSGSFGGTIREPMTDLIKILSHLVDNDGSIIIPHINKSVNPFTYKEKYAFDSISFDMSEYCSDIGCEPRMLKTQSKVQLLAKRWVFPCLSIHGIEGCFSQQGFKTVIPSKVTGKFSIRLVPSMDVEETISFVDSHIFNLVRELKITNNVDLIASGAPAWLSDVENENFCAARRAIKRVYNCDPDLTREGGSIPVTLLFQEIIGKNIVLIPMGKSDDGAHSQNEKLNIYNFINGIKVFAAYINELSKI